MTELLMRSAATGEQTEYQCKLRVHEETLYDKVAPTVFRYLDLELQRSA